MPLKAPRKASPTSRGIDALRREVAENLPIITQVSVRGRAGHGGRFQKVPYVVFDVVSDDERDTDSIVDAIVDQLNDLELDRGESFNYSAEVHVMQPGETPQLVRTVIFRLDDDTADGDGGDLRAQLATSSRTLQSYDRLLTRALGHVESSQALLASANEAMARNAALTVEMRRLEFEMADRMATHQREERRSEEEFQTIRELGGQFLTIKGAEAAREAESAKGGEKQPAWRRLIRTAKVLRERETVRAALGEKGSDLLDSLAASRNQAEVAEIVGALRAMVDAKAFDVWAVVRAAPELMPFADMLTATPHVEFH